MTAPVWCGKFSRHFHPASRQRSGRVHATLTRGTFQNHSLRMSVKIVRLGSARLPDEGTRIGTVRRPPRGVPKAKFARENWYDVWFPNLAPSVPTMHLGLKAGSPA